jgi:hypothetical protein
MSYYITTFCYGDKYEKILPKWSSTILNTCKNAIIKIFDTCNVKLKNGFQFGWWDVVRMKNNIDIIISENKPVVNIDIDLIIKKDIEPIVKLNYDLIFSREIDEDKAFPRSCSKILGCGICTGFYIIKPNSLKILNKVFELMTSYKFGNYGDQYSFMKYIVGEQYSINDEEIILDNVKYINKIIEIDGIKICILDFNIIVRNPILNINQFGNHINIDNVGGPENFLRYFDEDLENLPLTCRCGKIHLRNNDICKHLELRKN